MTLRRRFYALILLGLVGSGFVSTTLLAQEAVAKKEGIETKSDKLAAKPEAIQTWRQLKLGLFVNWRPVSVKEAESKSPQATPASSDAPASDVASPPSPSSSSTPKTPSAAGSTLAEDTKADVLIEEPNRIKFEANEWVELAKEAGMKYLVFTARHNDGFCNFDSKWTDNKVTSPDCPYDKDIVRELSDACHKNGIQWGIYYSQPDRLNDDHKQVGYLQNEVRELMTNYGKVNMLFFDGILDNKDKGEHGEKIIAMCRELQPEILINSREKSLADFVSPEPRRMNSRQTGQPWLTYMTLGTQPIVSSNNKIRSLTECIQTLVSVVGGDGNLLLNVSPMEDGQIDPRQATRLREIGDWLEKYGEAVYDTRGGPYIAGDWGASTYRDDTIYLHIFDKDTYKFHLPPLNKNVVSVKAITGGVVEMEERPHEMAISVTPTRPSDPVMIVKIKLDGPASEARTVR